MAGLTATIDPDGAALPLTPAYGFDVIGLSAPHADDEVQRVGSISTEGERSAGSRPSNQPLTVRLRITGRGDTAEARLTSFAAAQRALDQKVIKLRREGGVLRLGFPGLDTIDWDVVEVTGGDRLLDNRFMRRYRTEDEITFVCLPGGRGREREVPLALARDTPCLITEPFTVDGDMEAFGRLRLRNETDRDVRWLRWGREARHLSTDPTAELHYDAVDLTPLGSATISGNVVRATLAPIDLAILSTRTSGGQLTHVGAFEVRARLRMPATNAGEIQVRLEWRVGADSARAANGPHIFAANHSREGAIVNVNLGEIYVTRIGELHTWEGQVIARSSVVGDVLEFVDIELVPVAEGNGTLASVLQPAAPTSLLALDSFDVHATGALDGKTAPLGGTWTGAGSTGPFQVQDGVASRSVTTDPSGAKRFGLLGGSSPHSEVVAKVSIPSLSGASSSSVIQAGLVARYVDPANYCIGVIQQEFGDFPRSAVIHTAVAGVITFTEWHSVNPSQWAVGWHDLRLTIEDDGSVAFSVDGTVYVTARFNALRPGGALATGRAGLVDWAVTNIPGTRYYDDFIVAGAGSTSPDAAIFGDSVAELAHDAARRTAPTGGWGPVADVRGDYLRLAPAGVEGRSNRLIAIPSEGYPESAPDAANGRLSATLHVTPRYRTIPDLA